MLETSIQHGKTTPILLRLEQGVNDLKQQSLRGSGAETPISKTLNFSISMVNQISRTMQEAISRFEGRLTQAKEELLTITKANNLTSGADLSQNLPNFGNPLKPNATIPNNLSGNPMLNTFNIENSTDAEDITEEILGVRGKGITKSKFMGPTNLGKDPALSLSEKEAPKEPLEIDERLSAIIADIQSKHNIELSTELKETTQKILNNEPVIFMKTNLYSGYHYLYLMLSKLDKKLGILLLQPHLLKSFQEMIPEDVAKNQCQIITVDKLQELKPNIDVLLIENVELFED